MSGGRRGFPGFENLFCWRTDASGFLVTTSAEDLENDYFHGHHPLDTRIDAAWWHGRRRPSDVIRTSMGCGYLVSDRLRQVLVESRFSGWTVLPTVVTGKVGETIDGYHFLCVTGRAGRADPSRSRTEYVHNSATGPPLPMARGYYFDEESWDGSDVFVTNDGSCMVLCGRWVRDALLAAGITGLTFEALDEVLIPQ